MKRSDGRQDEKRPHESHMFAILASLFLHGVFVLGMMAITWFWGRPGFERGSAYTVSLVDAPLSLTQPPAPVVPPPVVAPLHDREEASVTTPKPPPEKPKVEKAVEPELPVAAPEPPPKVQ